MRKRIMLLLMMLFVYLFAFSCIVLAQGVTTNYCNYPEDIRTGCTYTCKLSLRFDTNYSILGNTTELPKKCTIGIELNSYQFQSLSCSSSSFSSFTFKQKKGSKTGSAVWEGYKTTTIRGTADLFYKIKAKVKSSTNCAGASNYMGTGSNKTYKSDCYFKTFCADAIK